MNASNPINTLRTQSSASTEDDFFHEDIAISNEYNDWSFHLAGMMVATTIMTSAATLPPPTISFGSSVSADFSISAFRRLKQPSHDAVQAFSTELQKKSRSLSLEDARLLRKIILSKSQPGVPRF